MDEPSNDLSSQALNVTNLYGCESGIDSSRSARLEVARNAAELAWFKVSGRLPKAGTEVGMEWFRGGRCALILASFFVCATAAQASTIIDLSAGGSATANGAIYEWTVQQATGSGAVDWFLRVRDHQSTQTRDIRIADLVVKNVSGIDYYEFLLDLNESSGHDRELINLDGVQIYAGGDLRYNSDVGANGDTTIVMDGTLNSGSGSGDLFFYVPVSVFAGTLPSDQVYFYSLFSNSDAGFEEWGLLEQASLNQITAVPEPGAMLLVGTGLLLAARRLRRTS